MIKTAFKLAFRFNLRRYNVVLGDKRLFIRNDELEAGAYTRPHFSST
jgi:hypothetical protein